VDSAALPPFARLVIGDIAETLADFVNSLSAEGIAAHEDMPEMSRKSSAIRCGERSKK
jgi:hypothetical protein